MKFITPMLLSDGLENPHARTLRKLAKTLGVEPRDLIGDRGGQG